MKESVLETKRRSSPGKRRLLSERKPVFTRGNGQIVARTGSDCWENKKRGKRTPPADRKSEGSGLRKGKVTLRVPEEKKKGAAAVVTRPKVIEESRGEKKS